MSVVRTVDFRSLCCRRLYRMGAIEIDWNKRACLGTLLVRALHIRRLRVSLQALLGQYSIYIPEALNDLLGVLESFQMQKGTDVDPRYQSQDCLNSWCLWQQLALVKLLRSASQS